jgi:hypothetical protein
MRKLTLILAMSSIVAYGCNYKPPKCEYILDITYQDGWYKDTSHYIEYCDERLINPYHEIVSTKYNAVRRSTVRSKTKLP